MDTTAEADAKEAAETQSLAERIDIINKATRGLYQAALILLDKAADKEEMPPELGELVKGCLSDALTLANCGLIALTEIADAQQVMAKMVTEEKAIIERVAANEKSTKRSFIGQPPEK